jgi:hypothetical protein
LTAAKNTEFHEEIALDSQMRGLPNIFSCDQIRKSPRVRGQVNTEDVAPFSSDSASRIEVIVEWCGDEHYQKDDEFSFTPPDLS